MKRFTVAVVVVLLTGFALAEDKAPKVVRVVGSSEVKTVPDRAVIQLGVEKQNASASMAKQSADAAARKILEDLRTGGIDEKDIQTTFLSLQPQFNYRKGMRISYFVAEQTLTVTVRDLSKLDGLLGSLIKAGGNRIDSIQYEISDLRKYRDQARDLAVKAAREKAQALAQALGQEIGKAQYIEEVPESSYQYSGIFANSSFSSFEGSKSRATSAPSTAAGQNRVSASVIVSFELN